MTDIGPTLREARMRAGLDISEIEERTKIRAKYLRALENEEWALLPGPAFTKGFLRSYADMLGLDARLLIDEYKRQWEEPHELDLNPVRPTIGADVHAANGRRAGRWLALAALIVVLAVALVLVGHLFGGSSNPSGTGSGLGATTRGGVSGGRRKTVARLVSCAPSAHGHTPRGCATLRIKPVAKVYACLVGDSRVRIDGERLARATGVYHARSFALTLGHGRVVLVVDGHHFDVPRSARPLSYAIKANRPPRRVASRGRRCVA